MVSMPTPTVLLPLFHATQTCLGVYTGLYSAIAIYNLQQREEQTERAAKYSNTAAHQLHKTRTTQTSGALATISSTLCSIILAIGPTGGKKLPLFLSLANAAGIILAYRHIADFWRHKVKVPFFQDYNEGIRASNQMLQAFQILSGTWIFAAVVYLWPGLTL
ncbi:hypothetical protein LTR99_010250 [Exophiala xenobiotica]|uniref:Uncharacterized protein n=1 Tax=Vermiconidia calcicola TaxID=1690605 RepID=A0AAV9Q4A7_9PEZI|nr:hypothetical protein LTR92_007168 [Exophiala xenobiotica]KAK5533969.1 hypothetical protein LTR25_006949 [Vermiconidia calcicola]KAK5534885.1 hypothetical protein LTR23_008560 [Chaetothyriales sp. CCFEE 6169]KAK5272138.1 hypothetical protein LTR96_001768 [Exophiala xenobiotica]KAK5292502.1 hypothetical protein LTR99_010250 [Exophiala xenobiotica]